MTIMTFTLLSASSYKVLHYRDSRGSHANSFGKEEMTKGIKLHRPSKPLPKGQGMLILTFSHYVLAYYGRFDDAAQLTQVTNRETRAYFKQYALGLKKHLSGRPSYYRHLSITSRNWELELIYKRLKGEIISEGQLRTCIRQNSVSLLVRRRIRSRWCPLWL